MSDVDRLLADLQSLHWWLTAGVFALAVNIASAYLKPRIDQWIERRSEKRRLALAKQKAETMLWAKSLLQDARLLQLAQTELISLRVKVATLAVALTGQIGAVYFVGSAPTTPIGNVFAGFVGTALAVQALALIWGAQEAEKVARRLEYVRHVLQEHVLGPEPSLSQPITD